MEYINTLGFVENLFDQHLVKVIVLVVNNLNFFFTILVFYDDSVLLFTLLLYFLLLLSFIRQSFRFRKVGGPHVLIPLDKNGKATL